MKNDVPRFTSSSPRELGREMGSAFKEKYETIRPIFWEIAESMGLDKEQMLKEAKKQMRQIETLPESEKIVGISESTEIPKEELVALGTIGFDLFKKMPQKEKLPGCPCCTDGAAAPPATKDGQTYLSWSWDVGYILSYFILS